MCRSPTGGYRVGLGLAEKLTRAGCPVTLCVEGLFAGQTFHGYVRDTMVGNLHWRGRTLLSGQISRESFAVTKSEENLPRSPSKITAEAYPSRATNLDRAPPPWQTREGNVPRFPASSKFYNAPSEMRWHATHRCIVVSRFTPAYCMESELHFGAVAEHHSRQMPSAAAGRTSSTRSAHF